MEKALIRVLITVPTDKRHEFVQALRSFERMVGVAHQAFRSIDDDAHFCLIQEWDSPEDASRFLDGIPFQFLTGALSVLGCEVDGKLFETSAGKKVL